MLENAQGHRRDRAPDLDALALDHLEHLARVEAPFEEHQRSATDQREAERVKPADVEQRPGEEADEPRIVVGERMRKAPRDGEGLVHRGDPRAMSERRALRQTGRPRREDDQRRVVLVTVRHARRTDPRRPLGLARRGDRCVDHRTQIGDVDRGDAGRHLGEALLIADHQGGLDERERVLDLLLAPPTVARRDDRPDRKARPQRDHPLRRVRGEDEDAVTASDAQSRQMLGHGVDRGERVAERQPPLALDEMRARAPAGRVLEQLWHAPPARLVNEKGDPADLGSGDLVAPDEAFHEKSLHENSWVIEYYFRMAQMEARMPEALLTEELIESMSKRAG